MKLLSYRIGGHESYGAVKDGAIIDLGRRLGARFTDMKALIAGNGLQAANDILATADPDHAMEDISYLLPVRNPEKILCVGVNYMNRNAEYKDGSDLPKYPSLFMRTPGSFVGHNEPIIKPLESDQLDYEGEIVIVIGKTGRRIAEQDASKHIFGLTLMNEGTIRDWVRHGKFNVTQGKNFERTGAIGPWIVTRDMFTSFTNLDLTTHVNGDLRQKGNTSEMAFPFSRILAYISTFMELHPGDIIATGTPTGSGARLDPPQYLSQGDTIDVESPLIGTLHNEVMDEENAGAAAGEGS